ncbi:MAG TPA: TM0106 family RecB-like putative nuclease, partial [Gaiellaceae bacterium]|nr:TM0106 family RecB-like putative nuclease [Gaiellaceae bacterium]
MRVATEQISFSPSDLTAYLACAHLTQLELRVARGELARPGRDDPQGDLVRAKGEEHEAAYLRQLREEGRDVVEIRLEGEAGEWEWERAARETVDAMRDGREVIYQAAFVDGVWRGLADFVVRQPDGTYEATDTKLARHPKPYFVIQLCFYSEQIGRIQGRPPERMHVVLGTGETASFRLDDFRAYYRRVRDRFLDAVTEPQETEPYPCDHCSLCSFLPLCEEWWEERDHLVRVAGIRRDQIARLGAAGIGTLRELGEADADAEVPRLAGVTFAKLRGQAALQLEHRLSGKHRAQTLEPEPGRGFALLPKPSPGDLFFDIEGDPFWETGRGLEYLLGLTELSGGRPRFHAIWAHDRDEEKRAFEQLVELVHQRLRADPGLHVYHYAPYEPSALKRLAMQYGTCEEEVDELLRRQVLVDLYAVVRQGLRISHPRYSLKNVEQFFMKREAELRAGDDSILLYERWRDERDPQILQKIADYNEEDCLSTYLLREWLLERKAEAESEWGAEIAWREPPDPREPDEEAIEEREERERLADELLERGETLAARLLDYHRREAKPVWWAYFDRCKRTSDELVEDAEAIGGLEPVRGVGERSWLFRFPLQQHKLHAGSQVHDPAAGASAGTIAEL